MVAALILIYVGFLKPSPLIRLNLNKIKAEGGSSALTLDTPTQVNGVGKMFTVKVSLDTKGYFVNAVQSYVQFDPNVLEVETTDTRESFCKFYPENSYSNEKGLIKVSCGSPYPGFNGKNDVVIIQFLPKAIKDTQIALTKDSMVLANDGKGTNLLHDFDNKEIRIKAGL